MNLRRRILCWAAVSGRALVVFEETPKSRFLPAVNTTLDKKFTAFLLGLLEKDAIKCVWTLKGCSSESQQSRSQTDSGQSKERDPCEPAHVHILSYNNHSDNFQTVIGCAAIKLEALHFSTASFHLPTKFRQKRVIFSLLAQKWTSMDVWCLLSSDDKFICGRKPVTSSWNRKSWPGYPEVPKYRP